MSRLVPVVAVLTSAFSGGCVAQSVTDEGATEAASAALGSSIQTGAATLIFVDSTRKIAWRPTDPSAIKAL